MRSHTVELGDTRVDHRRSEGACRGLDPPRTSGADHLAPDSTSAGYQSGSTSGSATTTNATSPTLPKDIAAASPMTGPPDRELPSALSPAAATPIDLQRTQVLESVPRWQMPASRDLPPSSRSSRTWHRRRRHPPTEQSPNVRPSRSAISTQAIVPLRVLVHHYAGVSAARPNARPALKHEHVSVAPMLGP